MKAPIARMRRTDASSASGTEREEPCVNRDRLCDWRFVRMVAKDCGEEMGKKGWIMEKNAWLKVFSMSVSKGCAVGIAPISSKFWDTNPGPSAGVAERVLK